MARWQSATLIFFAYLIAAAAVRPGLSLRARSSVIAGALLGVGLAALSFGSQADAFANVWIIPPASLLLGYWTSGLLFVRPMPRAERLLARLDERLRVQQIAARIPRPAAELLELAYAGIYPLIPIALYFAMRQGVSAERFWTMILVTDYLCFGMLPWVQTRPPRALGFDTPWRSRWRAVNLRLLDAGSVQVNTFPSGHAAEGLAAALIVAGGPVPLVAAMVAAAAMVSAGAVLGRYHYAADALAGWAVALLVFCSLRL